MSFTGIGPFHTPGDVPSAVTGPELLEDVYHAIGEAVDLFHVETAKVAAATAPVTPGQMRIRASGSRLGAPIATKSLAYDFFRSME
jgi:hypothetical protein